MTATVGSSEIAGRPENVFVDATDFSHLPEWEGTVISVRAEPNAPLAVRRRAVATRRVGRRPLKAREEITELNPERERVAA
jgi:Polyketide cyclase / dehydrase and lipid transport